MRDVLGLVLDGLVFDDSPLSWDVLDDLLLLVLEDSSLVGHVLDARLSSDWSRVGLRHGGLGVGDLRDLGVGELRGHGGCHVGDGGGVGDWGSVGDWSGVGYWGLSDWGEGLLYGGEGVGGNGSLDERGVGESGSEGLVAHK